MGGFLFRVSGVFHPALILSDCGTFVIPFQAKT
jgi:hypothetical protein